MNNPPIFHLFQIALMASVYATIVMSMERFLRLCRFQVMSQKVLNNIPTNVCLL